MTVNVCRSLIGRVLARAWNGSGEDVQNWDPTSLPLGGSAESLATFSNALRCGLTVVAAPAGRLFRYCSATLGGICGNTISSNTSAEDA
jgi:hypothetical protein